MYLRNVLFAIGLVALITGIVLAGVWIWQSGPNGSPAESPGVRSVAVLVAASDIRQGTLLRAEDVAWKAVPEQRVPPAAIRQAPNAEKSLLGAVTRRDFAAGEALVPSGLVKPGDRGFLAAVLSPGMRAIAIAVNASTSTAGLIQPGDYVDVILAQNVTGDTDSRHMVSETILQNVRVIAVDQRFAEGKPTVASNVGLAAVDSRVPKTITLEVDEENAKRLLVASQLGKVTLAMRALQGAYAIPARSPGDTQPVWATDVSAALRGSGRSAGSRTTAPSGAGRHTVVIMRGSTTQTQ